MKTEVQNTTITVSELNQWKSPIPYIFCGLALIMLGLAGLALIIRSCSCRESSSESSNERNPTNPLHSLQTEMETRVNVVIMAGETNPTFLAMPVPSISISKSPSN